MKRTLRLTLLCGFFVLGLVETTEAQPFVGTNQPGAGSLFGFTVSAGVTNLSLSVSNTASAFSHLYLKRGAGAAVTNYDFVSRLDKVNNNVNLEIPQLSSGTNYSLWVQTPTNSAGHGFSVALTTNRADARLFTMPILKPMEFSVTGTLSAGMTNFFQIDIPTNLPGWRIVLTASGTADADVYVQRGALPSTGSYLARSVNRPLDTLFLDSTAATNQTYFIAVMIPSTGSGTAQYTLAAEIAPLVTLTWEPGTTPAATTAYTNHSLLGGDYFFQITTLNAASGIWRTRVDVQSGEGDLFMKRGSLASPTSYDFYSTQLGSDGIALVQVGQYQTGQVWYATVSALPGAQWSIYSGNAFVEPLPSPLADSSGGTNTIILPEGMNFYRTTINSNTIAWRLGLNGLTNSLYVRQGAAPHGFSSTYYDWKHAGQILLVPPYLKSGVEYFVTVAGTPGQAFTLDSRQQPILELPFDSTVDVAATNYGYVTLHVTVPPEQIAWQLDLRPTSGDPSIAARFSAVASEDFNNAFAEMPGSPVKNAALVPPALTDGSYYLTVYGTPPFTATLTNSRPIITDVPYAFVVTNDLPGRQGWRFYRVTDIDQQLTSLGWELLLSSQVPGTEIALRRNAVPGRWAWRTNYNKITTTTISSNMDVSSVRGFLQFPRHPADIWYVGVNTTNQPLGSFILTSRESPRPLLSLGVNYSSSHVADQPAAMFQYFELDVPTNLLGVELRVANVGSGDPRLTVCRDLLPVDLRTILVNSNAWTPNTSTNWPSGAQVSYVSDWTGFTTDAQGNNESGHFFFASSGNPLEPGTYYVGVIGGPGTTNAMNYDLLIRGLFPSGSFVDLPFGSSNSRSPVAPHDVVWHRLTVPTNTPSLKLRLNTDSGESSVVLRQGGLPNYGAGQTSPTNLTGCKLQKLGNEHFLMLPYPTNTSILSGTYYVGIVGEGQNPVSPRAGSNTCSFTFFNQGSLVLTNVGSVDPLGQTSLVSTQSQEGGEIHGFSFTLVSNTPAIEVHLENRTGYPRMVLRADAQLASLPDPYGFSGGWTTNWADDKVIRIPSPAAGNYSLLVQAAGVAGKYTNASYTLDISAQQPQPLTFDQDLATVTNQAVDGWNYFQVTIPSDPLGWDLRLTNVTSGDPKMVICREVIPFDMSTKTSSNTVWTPFTATNWPSGFRLAPDKDWTGYTQSSAGTNETGRFFTIGMGNPLEPGNYIVGVASGGTPGNATVLSYQLVSRGIGGKYAIPAAPLPFAGGQSNLTALLPHDFAFYRVDVATNTPSWEVRLGMTSGEALLVMRKDGLPNFAATNSTAVTNLAGCKLQKTGNEHFVLLPTSPSLEIPAGSYYLGVVSEGTGPTGTRIGSNACACAVQSLGPLAMTDLGGVDDATPVALSVWQEGGSVKAFQYNLSTGVLAIVTRLANRVGNPIMTLRQGTVLPRTLETYGRQGGWTENWSSTNYIRVDQPAGGIYSLMVHAASVAGQYPDASYDLLIYSLVQGTIPLAFDGGQASIYGQLTGEWEYFSLDVPPDAVGWDLRLTNILSGSPRLVVCHSGFPLDLTSRLFGGGAWAWGAATNWPIAAQAAPAIDWTGYKNDPNLVDTTGTIFTAGMGGPLEPGHYIIGVSSAAGSIAPMSYTIASRGIGQGYLVPVTPLVAGTNSIVATNLPPREAAYYSIVITNQTPLWKLRMAPTIGEAMLVARAGVLPNVTAVSNILAITAGGGHKFQKPGVENALFAQPAGTTNLPPGTYYLAVVGEGRSPQFGGNTIGSGTTDFGLTSILPLQPMDLGAANSGTDLLLTNMLESGETACYQFSTPPGALGLTVSLENVAGNPLLRLRNDLKLPLDISSYGQDGSYRGTWESTNRIALASPTSGVYTVSVLANGSSTNWPQLSYRMRVHLDGGLQILSFDAGTAQITNHSDLWRVFQVTVPSTALGWDLRLLNVTNGSPRLVICRDQTPTSLIGHPELYHMTNWPSGWQIAPDVDWTALNEADGTSSTGRVFQVGLGNPLEAGTYYVGITNINSASPCSYTILSRGIGSAYTIPVVDVPFSFGMAGATMPAREGSWYRVNVPSNSPAWKVALTFDAGDGTLVAQRGWLPNVGAQSTNLLSTNLQSVVSGGKKMQKIGNEHLLYLAYGTNASTNLPAGTYYLGVISEGLNPNSQLGRIGSGSSSFTLTSEGSPPPFNLGVVGALDLLGQTTLQAGECETYQFGVPAGTLAVQVFFEETNGYPAMTLTTGSYPPSAPSRYGTDGGAAIQWQSTNVITIPNPAPANFSITAQATGAGTNFPGADYRLRVRSLSVPNVNFDAALNTNGLSNSATGLLQDGFKTYFRVQVPATVSGIPVIGWKVSLSALYGSPTMRVRQNALPDDSGTGTSAYFPREAVFVPDYLSPGTWYVEVMAAGLTDFTLTSETLRLERPPWQMPAVGQPVTTPGLPSAGPLFGDTSIDTNGAPLSADVDLETDGFHYYAVVVPPGNGGLLRTELDAISGNANLYLRTNAPPTLSHNALGGSGPLYNRALTNAVGTDYGNWVVLDGKSDLSLSPGIWYLAVHAAWGSNVRYRLQLSTGEIADLPFAGGSLTGQVLAAGDWRYYRVVLPTNVVCNWSINFSEQRGDVSVYVRDTLPPGQGINATDFIDWNRDFRNHGPYPYFTNANTYTLTVPPVRPGNVYYLGVRALSDSSFTINSMAGSAIMIDGTIAFMGGYVTNPIPPGGVLRYRIDVPPQARRWSHSSFNASTVKLYLDQGTLPTMTALDHWYSSGANSTNNRALYNSSWPWLPGYSYFLAVTNTTASIQPFSFRMDGKDCSNDDFDNDGLPDCWEIAYFGSIYTYGPNSDPDGDGLSNLQEFLAGTDPTVANSNLVLLTAPAPTGDGRLSFSAIGTLNRTYRVQGSATLAAGSWVDLTNFVQVLPSQPIAVPVDTSRPARFFRVVYP